MSLKVILGYTKKGDVMTNLPFLNLLSYLGWRDLLEILFFSALFYYVSRWLHADKHTNLLFCLYGYCLLIFTSKALDLSVTYSFLTTFAPVIAILFILFHHTLLQKNFISQRHYTPATTTSDQWHQKLIRIMLVTRNKGMQLHVIIEHTDNLEMIVTAPFMLDIPIQQELMHTLIMSSSFDTNRFVWLRSDGIIRSINASLAHNLDDEWKDQSIKNKSRIHQNSLIICQKTNALVLTTEQEGSSFTLMINDTVLSSLSAENCIKLLKKHTITVAPLKGIIHETKKQNAHQQHHTD